LTPLPADLWTALVHTHSRHVEARKRTEEITDRIRLLLNKVTTLDHGNWQGRF
jgi:hypothetical protein